MRVRTIAIILCLLTIFIGTPSQSYASASYFSDTKNHWASATIQWAVSNKITEGYPDGTFQPNRKVSEAEFLVMFIRAYEIVPEPINEYRRHWTDDYYAIADRLNYPVNGIQNMDMRNKPLIREKVAEILTAADGMNYLGDNAIQYVLGGGYSQGTDPHSITIANFKGNTHLTRAEAVQFIKNAKENGLIKLNENPKEPSDITLLPSVPSWLTQKILDAVLPSKSSRYQIHYNATNVEVYDVTRHLFVASFGRLEGEGRIRDYMIRIHNAKNEDDVAIGLIMAKAAGLDVTPSIVADVIELTGTSEYIYEGDNYLVVFDQSFYKDSLLIFFDGE